MPLVSFALFRPGGAVGMCVCMCVCLSVSVIATVCGLTSLLLLLPASSGNTVDKIGSSIGHSKPLDDCWSSAAFSNKSPSMDCSLSPFHLLFTSGGRTQCYFKHNAIIKTIMMKEEKQNHEK